MKRILSILSMVVLAFGLIACNGNKKEDPALEKLQQAHDGLNVLIKDPSNILADFEVPAVLAHGVKAEWSSSEPGIISFSEEKDGMITVIVNRPQKGAGNASVELKATLSIKAENSDEILKKEWSQKLTVIEATLDYAVIGTIAEVIAKAKKDDWVKMTGVTLSGKTKDGIYITDETGSMFVYLAAEPNKNWEVGKAYDVEGQFTIYYNAYQIQSIKGGEPVVVSPSAATPVELKGNEVALADITGRDLPSETSILQAEYVTIEGYVHVEGTGNYNTFLMPIEGYEGKLDKTKAVMFYYQGNKEDVESFVGRKIKLTVFLHAYRTNDNVWTVNYTGTKDEIETLALTPEEALVAVEKAVKAKVAPDYIADATIDLITEEEGVSVVWTSSHPDVIDPKTGKVTVKQDERVEVTLTAKLTIGELTETVTIKTVVGLPEESTIEDVYKGANGQFFKVKGYVTAQFANGSFALQHEGFAITLRGNTADLEKVVGKEVVVVGKKDVFNGLHQLASTTIIESKEGTKPKVEDITSLVGNKEALELKQALLVKVVNGLVKEDAKVKEDKYTTVEVTLIVNGKEITVRSDSRIFEGDTNPLAGLKAGNVVTIDGAHLTWFNNPQIAFTNANQLKEGTMTDEELVLAQLNALTLVEKLYATDVIDLETKGFAGTPIVWTSSNPLVVIAEGKLTVGEVTEETQVTITASMTKGEVTKTKKFTVTLKVSGEEQETILATYDFTKFSGETGKEFSNETALVTAFNGVSDNTNMLVSATNLSKIYQGNGTGGDEYANSEKVLKTGTGKANGTMTLTFAENVTKVTLLLRGWGSTDTLTINGVTKTLPSTLEEITFELDEASSVLSFEFGKRALIEGMIVFGE